MEGGRERQQRERRDGRGSVFDFDIDLVIDC